MKTAKRSRLAAAGWTTGSAAEFLSLTPDEAVFVEVKVALSLALRRWRAREHLTQGDVARLLHSSQSRVAKMESADPSVTIDLLLRSLLRLGASRRQIARAIA